VCPGQHNDRQDARDENMRSITFHRSPKAAC
jgi:hypothetical protein